MAFGDYPDSQAFDYRKRKETEFGELKRKFRREDTAVKKSVRTSIGYIDIYLYFPDCDPSHVKNDVGIFNFHGGGYVLRDWELDVPYCQQLSNDSGCVVANVDYVTGPEYKFPIPQTTALEVLKACARHADDIGFRSSSFVVCGHSAGANLAAALCELACDADGVDIVGLAMDYPALKPMLEVKPCKDSTRAIPSERMEQYASWAFNSEADLTDPLACPLLAKGVSWPETLINVAEYDSLCKEALDFAHILANQGVAVDVKCYEGCMHGFTHSCFVREYDEAASKDAWARIALFARRLGGVIL